MKIYAVYKGDKFLYEGTAKECAKYFGVKACTVYCWNGSANKRNCLKNKKKKDSNRKIAIVIEEE